MSETYGYEYKFDDIVIDCRFYYYPGYRGQRERVTGLPLEPDEPPDLEIMEAKVGGVDILPLLSSKQVEDITYKALECLRRSL